MFSTSPEKVPCVSINCAVGILPGRWQSLYQGSSTNNLLLENLVTVRMTLSLSSTTQERICGEPCWQLSEHWEQSRFLQQEPKERGKSHLPVWKTVPEPEGFSSARLAQIWYQPPPPGQATCSETPEENQPLHLLESGPSSMLLPFQSFTSALTSFSRMQFVPWKPKSTYVYNQTPQSMFNWTQVTVIAYCEPTICLLCWLMPSLYTLS